MKPIILTCALIVYTALMCAQADKKPTATVRIKKIEKINGVEKITDTTYMTDNLSSLHPESDRVNVEEWTDESGHKKKVVIISNGDMKDKEELAKLMNNTESLPQPPDPPKLIEEVPPVPQVESQLLINLGSEMTPEEEKAWASKMANPNGLVNDSDMVGKTIIIKKGPRCNATAEEMKNAEEFTVTIIKKVNISDASTEDLRLLGKPSAESNGKLAVEQLNLYPNPNNGRFNLSFSLPDKGDTEVKVLDLKGQTVFNEKLAGFSGSYSKEVDISKNPKGIYFVRVEQGRKSLVKKVMVE